MKLGIFSWYGFQLPIQDRQRHIREAGFGSTMLWWGDETNALDFKPAVDRAESIGLGIENIHLPIERPNDLWSSDRRTRAAIAGTQLERLRACRDAGIPMAVLHVTSGPDLTGPTPEGLETMTRLAEEADRLGITLAVENTRKPDCIAYLLDRIPGPRFGLCYDTSHGRLYEPEPFFLLRKYADRVKCFHVSDNDGQTDLHHIPGRGVIDWAGFIASFPKNHYSGSLSLEVYPESGEIDEMAHLAAAFRAAENLKDRIEGTRRG